MSKENGLSGEQEERLAILIEECGEVLHMAGKIMRHGYQSYNPVRTHEDYKIVNNELLTKELGDLTFAIRLLCYHDLSLSEINKYANAKRTKIVSYIHYNQELLGVEIDA